MLSIVPFRPSEISWFPRHNVSLNDPISLIFIWYLIIDKIQVEFEREVMFQFCQELWPKIALKKLHILVSAQ